MKFFCGESEFMLKSNILKFIGVFVTAMIVAAFVFTLISKFPVKKKLQDGQLPVKTTNAPKTAIAKPSSVPTSEAAMKPSSIPTSVVTPVISSEPLVKNTQIPSPVPTASTPQRTENTPKPEKSIKPEKSPKPPTSQKTQVIPEKTPAATLRPTQQSAQTIIITKTIVVKAGTTYDGKGVRIVAQGMGKGDMDEGQKPVFKLEKGANLKNVRIGAPGCDGVHCYGDNIVENVVWEDVGEDALTVKKEGSVTVKGGAAYNADGNIFQLNQPCTFTVSDFTGDVFAKAIRQDGGTSFKCTIYLENCTFSNADECIARTDSKKTQLYYKNLNITNADELWIFPSKSQIHTY